jgi:ribosomal protein L25 (general stress protein Ctc)
LIILSAAWSSTVYGRNGSEAFFDPKTKMQIIQGVLNKKLVIMPQLNKLNFGFGRYNGIEYIYEKTISKIFFQDKKLNAEIIDVSIEETEITLELFHPILGTGTVNFSFSADLIQQTTHQDIQNILLETLGDENHQYVVLDPANRLYHLWSCNHFADPGREARMKLEDADQQGYRPSKICFKKIVYLPELSIEKAIEAEWTSRLNNYESIETKPEKQMRLSSTGEKILKNWPFQLQGYNYAFYLAESSEINAFAIPTGKIIITTALFDSLDKDVELEALLVFAIATIEQRHSLKNYYVCVEDQEYTAAMKKLATLTGALGGPAGGGISGALSLALPSESCNPQSLISYQYGYVQQADAMVALYFDIHKKDRREAVSLIKKLQFSELTIKLHPDLRMHHPQKISDYTRIQRMQNIQFKNFNKNNHFVLKRSGKPPVQLNLKYHQIYKKENKVHIYLDQKVLAQVAQTKEGKTVIWLSITDKNGVHRFEHQNDLLTEDVWGVHLTFSASSRKKNNFLQDPEIYKRLHLCPRND